MYAPVSETAASFFGTSTSVLNGFTVLYFAAYVVFAGPAAWMLTSKVCHCFFWSVGLSFLLVLP